jgi:molecular chaperone GrpE
MDDIEIIQESSEDGVRDPIEVIKKLKDRIKQAESEKKEYLDGWQRAKADLVNARRDEERKLQGWKERVEGHVLEEFLIVLDSFDLALSPDHRAHLSPDVEKGFILIRSQFMDVLRRFGVEEIKTEGVEFNPHEHEAIDYVLSDEAAGAIIQEFQKGYKRGEVVLRPARVKVSKGSDEKLVAHS